MEKICSGSRDLWVGLGCQRGVSRVAIGRAIESIFTQSNLDLATIAGIATIDRKADELGLVDYCHEMGWFLKIYSLERLNAVKAERPSALVAKLVGSASIAEAAALCAAQSDILLVPKQKFSLDGVSEWVTIAVAVEVVDCVVSKESIKWESEILALSK